MAFPALIVVTTPDTGPGDDTVALTYPTTDLRHGDVLVGLIYVNAGAGQTVTNVSVPNGWDWQIAATATGVQRTVVAFYRMARGTETGTITVTCQTSGGTGQLDGCFAQFRDAERVQGYNATGSAGVTNSTTPGPASITTTVNEQLAVAAFAYPGTSTITTMTGWVDANGRKGAGPSFDFQTQEVPTAATISGSTATLGASQQWGVISFALRPFIETFVPAQVIVT